MSKSIVIYFSQNDEYGIKDANKDNARIAAEAIKDAVRSDIFRVEFHSNHPKDVWYTSVGRMRKALKGDAPLKNYLDSVSKYDNIFICGPCWYGSYPAAIFSQLKRLKLDDKKVMCLVVHDGCNPRGCAEELERKYRRAIYGDSFIIENNEVVSSLREIKDWALKEIEDSVQDDY